VSPGSGREGEAGVHAGPPTAPGSLPPNLLWEGDRLLVLDQRKLPAEETYLVCRRWTDVVEAIRALAVRGAPAIGIAGAYGVALAPPAERAAAAAALKAARPTAVNLAWAVDRALAAPDPAAEAVSIHREDAERCDRLAAHGAAVLPRAGRILTICHTGALATGGRGTALAAIARAEPAEVLVCETRPLLQGARLTMWECGKLGLPATLIADGAAGWMMARGRVDAVAVGADRIARDGAVANKVGTYALAVLARHHGIPFYVVAPESTFDARTPSGDGIPIEERDPEEVRWPAAPPGVRASNPAFDVTPACLVTAYVTDRGVLRPAERAPAGWPAPAREEPACST
jgi:methylthioribose-1-phosphate isomerase